MFFILSLLFLSHPSHGCNNTEVTTLNRLNAQCRNHSILSWDYYLNLRNSKWIIIIIGYYGHVCISSAASGSTFSLSPSGRDVFWLELMSRRQKSLSKLFTQDLKSSSTVVWHYVLRAQNQRAPERRKRYLKKMPHSSPFSYVFVLLLSSVVIPFIFAVNIAVKWCMQLLFVYKIIPFHLDSHFSDWIQHMVFGLTPL